MKAYPRPQTLEGAIKQAKKMANKKPSPTEQIWAKAYELLARKERTKK